MITETSIQIFRDALEEFITAAGGVSAAATALSVSRATVYTWRKTPCIPNNPEVLSKLNLEIDVSLSRSKKPKS